MLLNLSISFGSKPRSGGQPGAGCLFLFGLFFVAIGSMASFWYVRNVILHIDSANWVETPCRILSSNKRLSDGTVGVEVRFAYTYAGREYESDSYRHFKASTASGSWQDEVVAQYPAGSERVCYVNPRDQTQAVLDRSFGWDLVWPAFVLLFPIAGVWVWTLAWRSRRVAKQGPQLRWMPERKRDKPVSADGIETLTAHRTKLQEGVAAAVVGLVFAAVAWFVFGGGTLIGLHLLFVVVGLGFAVFGLRMAWIARLPRPTVRIDSSGVVAVGGELKVDWSIPDRARALQRLSFALCGVEHVVLNDGESKHKKSKEYRRIPIAELTSQSEIMEGSATVRVPSGAIHSLETPHYQVQWVLEVSGETLRSARWTDEFPLVVVPDLEGKAPVARSGSSLEPAAPTLTDAGCEIVLVEERAVYRAGDRVRGVVRWTGSDKLFGRVDGLLVRLCWRASGSSVEEDFSVDCSERIELRDLMFGEYAFAFTLPDGPCSYRGWLFRLTWEVQAVELPRYRVVATHPIVFDGWDGSLAREHEPC